MRLLDEKKITFEMAYIVADLRELEIKLFLEYRDRYSDRKIDLERLKKLPHKEDKFAPKSRERVKEVFILVKDTAALVKHKQM